ncbi:hypothetical protein EXU57_12975 [Segetibacter sp. 3557_3]|uniref:choice-of-anchor J domain-containing protein n=1 Tax=Segetibacter sp. 3557_3 TaxID=2547429 RepID=UPI0010585F7E|nr:choice-of-anchor J domain-containing protein [Segetibacter sp. 3557_3]TDH25611.1 hypothetical protein EXU57_12975 [Segetibacter sp. 3557_3]
MKKMLPKLFLWAGIPALLFSSCVNDKYLIAPPPVADQSFVEEFDTVSAASNRGWKFLNVSESKGPNIWQQAGAVTPWFEAYSSHGSNVGFIGADYTSTSAAAAIISNWLVSPVVTLQNGDTISFYTRAVIYADGAGDSTDYANRLQLRLSTNGESTNVGSAADPGDFTRGLIDINPNLEAFSLLNPIATAFPYRWTRFQVTLFGLQEPVRGRFAFRYFVEGAGSNGIGSGVGVDLVTYKSKRQQ